MSLRSKRPLRKKFAIWAHSGFNHVLLNGALFGALGGGAWYGTMDLLTHDWDEAPIEARDTAMQELEAEFSHLEASEDLMDAIKMEREEVLTSGDKDRFEALGEEYNRVKAHFENDIVDYSEKVLLATNIHEKDYQDLAERFNDSNFPDYTYGEADLYHSWGSAATRNECLADPENTTLFRTELCMKHEDKAGDILPTLMIVAPSVVFLMMSMMGFAPVPSRWGKLSDRPIPNVPEKQNKRDNLTRKLRRKLGITPPSKN